MESIILTIIDYFTTGKGKPLLDPFRSLEVEKLLNILSDHQQTIFVGALVVLFVLYLLHELYMLITNALTNRAIAKRSGNRPRIIQEGHDRKILILGDSTGYGTGADNPEDTLVGRFAHDFPNVEINNYAVNGSITHDLLDQIQRVEDKRYNLTIISSGGNDTWKFTDLFEVEKDLRDALGRVSKITGKNIVLIIYNNDASGPVFPFFLRHAILKRTRQVNEIYTRVGNEYGIQVVPVFLPGEKCPKNFFSRDGLHPSSEGYRIMYIRLWAALYAHRYDYNLREY